MKRLAVLFLALGVMAVGCGKKKSANDVAYTGEQSSTGLNESVETSERKKAKLTFPGDESREMKSVEGLETEESVDILSGKAEKMVIGATENAYFPAYGITLPARIDTGATTTSIDARNIVALERDGKNWVRFEFAKKELELPVERIVKIKRHGAESSKRYSVNVKISVKSLSQLTEVTLTDRSSFTYPVLIGRNFLKDQAIVDVSQKNHNSAGSNK